MTHAPKSRKRFLWNGGRMAQRERQPIPPEALQVEGRQGEDGKLLCFLGSALEQSAFECFGQFWMQQQERDRRISHTCIRAARQTQQKLGRSRTIGFLGGRHSSQTTCQIRDAPHAEQGNQGSLLNTIGGRC